MVKRWQPNRWQLLCWLGIGVGFSQAWMSALLANPTDSAGDLEARILDLENDVARLRGRVEELELKQGQGSAPSGLSSTTVSPPPPATGASAGPTVETTERPEVVDAYNKALDLLQAKNFPVALASFHTFSNTYPQSPLNEMALYWTGVIQLIQKDGIGAKESFSKILERYPNTSRRAEILQKLEKIRGSQEDQEAGTAELS